MQPYRVVAAEFISHGFVGLLLLLGVVAGSALGLYASWRWFEPEALLPTALGLLALVAVVATCVWLGRREWTTDRVALLLLAAVLVTRLLYILVVSHPPLSDFGVMWEYAVSTAVNGYRPPAGVFGISEVRTLPFLMPAAILGGGHPLAFQVANSVAITASAAIVYLLTRSLAGRTAGVLALALVLATPEPLVAAEIPTHDIPGTLFILSALAMMHWLERSLATPTPMVSRASRAVLGSVGIGIIIFLADLQRGVAPFLFATAALGVVLTMFRGAAGSRWRLGLYGVVLPYLIMSACWAAVSAQFELEHVAEASSRAKWIWVAGYANSESSGWSDNVIQLKPALSQLDDADLRHFAIARTTSDLIDAPLERPANFAKRLARLYSLGDQPFFYLDSLVVGGSSNAGADLLESPPSRILRGTLAAYMLAFRVLFLIAGAAAVVWLIACHDPTGARYRPILFVALLAVALGLLGESQPRYMFSAWFILPIYVGMAATALRENRRPVIPLVLRRVRRVGAAAVLALVGLSGTVIAVGALPMGSQGRFISSGKAPEALDYGRSRYEFILSHAEPRIEVPLPAGAAGGVQFWRVQALITVIPHADQPCRVKVRLAAGPEAWERSVTPGSVVWAVVRRIPVIKAGTLSAAAAGPDLLHCDVRIAFPWVRYESDY